MKPGTIPPDPFGQTTDRVKMNPPRASSDLIEPAGPIDPEVRFLIVRSMEGHPIALLANYSLHYVGATGGGAISADYFGAFATKIAAVLSSPEQDPPFVGILSNGTSGDINNINFREGSETPGALRTNQPRRSPRRRKCSQDCPRHRVPAMD